MKHEKYDAWQEAANNSGGIEGIHVKFGKGCWTIDNDEAQTGEDGFRLCPLMDTAMHAEVKWSNDRTKTVRRLNRFAVVAPSKEPLEIGWSPYTLFQCVGANGDYIGQMATFASSSWGGRLAFHALIRPWLLRGRLEFPICTLGSKPKKNDVNGNIDPVFKIVGWAPRSDFAALLPPDDEPPPSSGTAAPIDDDSPF